MAETLSHKRRTFCGWWSKNLRSCLSQSNSEVIEAIALYSASVEDLETVGYFFDFQVRRESPMKIQKPVVDFLLSKQLP